MDWFKQLTGFAESGYEETRAQLAVEEGFLKSRVNGRAYGIGRLETPSLGELRKRVDAVPNTPGRLIVRTMSGDVSRLHSETSSRGAIIQVASQFNLLEMTHYDVTPEQGVTRYADDHTQGPACAMAAGAATIYRNYFVPVDGRAGQTRDRQIDTLRDLSNALGEGLVEMRNGYALISRESLELINAALSTASQDELDSLRSLLRIGLHWGVEVTAVGPGQGQRLSQAFCSALPVAYSRIPPGHWEPFARLVLEASYEATLLAAIINAGNQGSEKVYLTRLGGGVFGNQREWISLAIRRALERVRGHHLEVYLVSYGQVPDDLRCLADEFA